jgi:hypothetical protein
MNTSMFLDRLERLAELFKSPTTRLPELLLLEIREFRRSRQPAPDQLQEVTEALINLWAANPKLQDVPYRSMASDAAGIACAHLSRRSDV